jgi:hypothetical protein
MAPALQVAPEELRSVDRFCHTTPSLSMGIVSPLIPGIIDVGQAASCLQIIFS